jgi:hypothetical protein
MMQRDVAVAEDLRKTYSEALERKRQAQIRLNAAQDTYYIAKSSAEIAGHRYQAYLSETVVRVEGG